jgi:hypothetical protein
MTILESFPESVAGHFLLKSTQPMVYGWFRKDKCLYIGSTTSGLKRIFSHNVIGVVEPIQPEDEIKFKIYSLNDEICEIESELILQLRPIYNPTSIDRICREINCRVCKKRFKQSRWWQQCCSQRCRVGSPVLPISEDKTEKLPSPRQPEAEM